MIYFECPLVYCMGTSLKTIMPSTVIASLMYDVETSTLRVKFVSGMVYHYKDVPEEVYLALKSSGAKGIFLNQHIKGKYQFEKIESNEF